MSEWDACTRSQFIFVQGPPPVGGWAGPVLARARPESEWRGKRNFTGLGGEQSRLLIDNTLSLCLRETLSFLFDNTEPRTARD